jgi:hypothetical protein
MQKLLVWQTVIYFLRTAVYVIKLPIYLKIRLFVKVRVCFRSDLLGFHIAYKTEFL